MTTNTPRLIELDPPRTYATKDNALKAVEKVYGNIIRTGYSDLRFVLLINADGRWYPAFIGESAIQAGVHNHFCIIG